ncbi:hypothetical protein HK105_205100 [Polyrhizophydium stewartii]|uniref:Lysosomal dipeptide transporter MFSD1 n=1 Tax=Polyrhizophydium stewartii TaxID=2732419 RepID=A0ABR4N6T7_9FUNG
MRPFGGGPLVVRTSLPGTPPAASTPAAADAGPLRWVILMLSCFLLFGNYYAYDNPAALNRPLCEFLGHDYDTWQYELNLLYAVYSFPNMLLPFFGGQMVDRFSPQSVLLVLSAAVCIGQTLFSLGVSLKSFGLMLAGRVLFGIGGESIGVVQSSITTSYFRNKELAFALGLNLCISRLGSVVNSVLSPRIAASVDASAAVWAGSASCYVSLACAVVLAGIIHAQDRRANAARKSLPALIPTSGRPQRAAGGLLSEECTPLLSGQSDHDSPESDTALLIPDGADGDANLGELTPTEADRVDDAAPGTLSSQLINSFTNLHLLPFSFWMLCLICILLYGTVVPFNNIASDFLMSKWYPGDTQTAGVVMSIPDLMSTVLVPIFGYLVDRYGGRAAVLLACALVIAGVHLTLGLTMLNPVIPLVVLGFSYSLYGVAIWPSVATVVQHREQKLHSQAPDDDPPRLLGAAFGLSTSALNASLTVVPLMTAQIRVQGGSFLPVELFFVALALVGALCCGVLWVLDLANDSVLQMPELVPPSPTAPAGSVADDDIADDGDDTNSERVSLVDSVWRGDLGGQSQFESQSIYRASLRGSGLLAPSGLAESVLAEELSLLERPPDSSQPAQDPLVSPLRVSSVIPIEMPALRQPDPQPSRLSSPTHGLELAKDSAAASPAKVDPQASPCAQELAGSGDRAGDSSDAGSFLVINVRNAEPAADQSPLDSAGGHVSDMLDGQPGEGRPRDQQEPPAESTKPPILDRLFLPATVVSPLFSPLSPGESTSGQSAQPAPLAAGLFGQPHRRTPLAGLGVPGIGLMRPPFAAQPIAAPAPAPAALGAASSALAPQYVRAARPGNHSRSDMSSVE